MPPSSFTVSEFARLQEQVAQLETKIQESTEATASLDTKVSELLELFRDFKGAQRVLEQLAKIIKPMVWLVATIAAYITWHQTNGPKG